MPAPATTTATDQTTSDDKTSSLFIPDEVKQKFPQLLEWVLASRSMDDEERQYWIDVLPIMSQDQIDNLKDILKNEQDQIAAAEKAYAGSTNEVVEKAKKIFDEAAYMEKKRVRLEMEKKHEEEERAHEAELLEGLANL